VTGRRASAADVVRRAAAAFTPSRDVRIGAEVEWLVYHRSDPMRAVTAAKSAAVAAGRLPAGGSVTIEPGGQVELVTVPQPGPRQLVDAIEADTAVLAQRFAAQDLALVPLGLDPVRAPHRTLDLPRYRAMEHYFARVSPAGLQMMSLTASLQLSIDWGIDPATTWRRAHTIAPVLSAAFANSPTSAGSEPQPVSLRQRVWTATDPSRTAPVGGETDDWLPYILDAQVMLCEGPDAIELASTAQSFGEWLHGTAPPSTSELDLHVTTLFPPLRPRGFLELRMIDALPAPGRAAAIAAVWAILTDDRAGELASQACRALADPWRVACDEGLGNAEMRAASATLLEAAANSAHASDRELGRACEAWRDRTLVGEVTFDDLLGTAEPAAAV
jgi:glutamate--cysteine ligase